VICDGPFEDESGCVDDEDCDDPPTGDFDCPSGVATLSIGAATGPDGTLYEISPGLWQGSSGWILQSPGIDPNGGGSGTCVGSDWVVYWGVVGTADATSCVHCGAVVTDPEDPFFGCIGLADSSGGGSGPESGLGDDCASESYVCCEEEGGLMAAVAAGRPLTLKTKARTPCQYEGRNLLTGKERAALGLGQSVKRWRLCMADDTPNKAKVVGDVKVSCRCSGCGPRCSSYTPKQTES
jgi:hypothetical protein